MTTEFVAGRASAVDLLPFRNQVFPPELLTSEARAYLAGEADTVPFGTPLPVLVTIKQGRHGAVETTPWRDNAVLQDDCSTYFCISTCHADAGSRRAVDVHRRDDHLAHTFVIVLDDIGTKVAPARITLSPSYKMETSPGNYQYGYFLKVPVDPRDASALIRALARAELTDAGATSATRVMRVPGSVNYKPAHGGFRSRIIEQELFDYTFQELVEGFGVELRSARDDASPDVDMSEHRAGMTMLRSALVAIPNERPEIDRDSWLNVGFALRRSIGDDALPLWLEFSRRHPTHSEDNAMRFWDTAETANRPGITLGTVFHMAAQHGWNRDEFLKQNAAALAEALWAKVPFARLAALRAMIDPRPTIIHDPARADLTAEAVARELVWAEQQPLWAVGGYPVYVDGSVLVSVDRSDPRHKVPTLGVVRIDETHLLNMVPKVAHLQQWRQRGNARPHLVDIAPPPAVLKMLPTSAKLNHALKPYLAIAGTPFMRPDGSICTARGYDTATGTWLQTPLDITVPDEPTKEQAREALALLRSLLKEMNFAGKPEDGSCGINEAVALCAMMGVVMRPSFEAMPALLIDGTAAGAGKSYFTKLLGTLATGKDPAMLSWPQRKEEFDKLIDSLLYDAVSMIVFDNCNGVQITGQKICSAVSESEIGGRFLGKTASIKLTTRGTSFIFNGNRLGAKEDFSARQITMRLAPRVVIAREIQYTANPLAMMRQARAKYVEAVLTIARSFRVSRTADDLLPKWGGFGEWSDCIRSALVWLGCPDVVDTTTEAVTSDEDMLGNTLLVRAAHAFRPDGSPWKVAELVAHLSGAPTVLAELREVMDPDDHYGLGKLGRMLGDWLRTRAAGRLIELEGGTLASIERVRGTVGGVARWRVVSP